MISDRCIITRVFKEIKSFFIKNNGFSTIFLSKKKAETGKLFLLSWSECRDSNSRPLEPHSSAIPNFATPGFCLRPADRHSILAHHTGKCKHYFTVFRKIFQPLESCFKTFPMFQSITTCFSASTFSLSFEYST